jgi:hypothetical protein
MGYTLAQSIGWSQSLNFNLDPTVYAGYEPAMTSANTVVAIITSAPFVWPWNRNLIEESISQSLGQDYTVDVTDFGFLEKCSLDDGGSPPQIWELENVHNTLALGPTSQISRPSTVATQIVTPASVAFRFGTIPDEDYTATFIYQEAPVFFTSITQDWNTQCGIPYGFIDIFNALFLSEMYQQGDDAQRAAQYRQRGMAALVTKAVGLDQMTKNMILEQWSTDEYQRLFAQARAQQYQQARIV